MEKEIAVREIEGDSTKMITLRYQKNSNMEWEISILDEVSDKFTSRRFSHALKALRRKLESDGWFLLCNASRIDVSSFNRSLVVDEGLKGYVIQLEEQFKPDTAQMVWLLDEIPKKYKPALISEQEEFRLKWMTFNGIRLDTTRKYIIGKS